MSIKSLADEQSPSSMSGGNAKPAGPGKVSDGSIALPAYRNYVLGLILIGSALNFLDRQVVSILLEPIKREFGVSDSSLGFLSGLSFALFYATVGIPIAAIADRTSRRMIISLSMAVWSAMTAAGCLAQSFLQLVAARFLVGVGEAGFGPAALSMLADYVPRHKRAMATAVFSVGAMGGSMMGLLVGGFAVQHIGWRGAMLVAGAPGVAFALLFWLTVREPVRGQADGVVSTPQSSPGLFRSAAKLWRIRSYRYIALGAGFSSLVQIGITMWMPSLLARSYHMPASTIGLLLGPLLGGSGALGALTAGFVTDRTFRRDARWTVWIPAISSLVAMPFMIGAFLSHTPGMTLVLFGVANFFCIFFSPGTSSIIQSLVPLKMRAIGSAWTLMTVNLVGLGLGPLAIGFTSQLLGASLGAESLRYALLATTPLFLVPIIFYGIASKYLRQDGREQGGVDLGQ